MTTINVETLAKENVRLYEENLKLRLMLGKGTSELNVKGTKQTKNNKQQNTNKNNQNNKNQNKNKNQKTNSEKKDTNSKRQEVVKEDIKAELSKFQQEREAKKSIVLAKRLEKVPVPEIAKLVNQSEPTVRNYIRELRSEGRLVK